MTELAFHFNAPDRLGYTARLLRKAWLRGARVTVLVPPHEVDELARQIWLVGQGDFVPHARPGDPPAVHRHSPIRLVEQLDEAARTGVLVNLCAQAVSEPQQHERIIEVVTLDEADRAQARQRWRQYVACGVEPLRHDLKQAGA